MNKNKSLTEHLLNSRLTSIISISLVIFLIGLTSLVLLTAGDLSVAIRENLCLSVVLKDNLKETDIQKLQKTLDASPYTKATLYIDKEQAAKELTQELGQDPTEFLGYNPLLGSIELNLYSPYANNDSIALIETELRRMPEVKEVVYQKSLIEAVNDNVHKISLVLIALSVLLLLISYALISNTVRLSVYAKRFLIHTMKLVGATGRFIRRPFLLQGLVNGLVSSVLAIGMLSLLLYLAQSEVASLLTSETIDTLLSSFVIMLLSGLLITLIATFHAVTRYLSLSVDDMYAI